MEIEFLSDWIYTFLLLPIVILFQRQFAISSKVTVLETKKDDIETRLDELEIKIDIICSNVSFIKGQLEIHLSSS